MSKGRPRWGSALTRCCATSIRSCASLRPVSARLLLRRIRPVSARLLLRRIRPGLSTTFLLLSFGLCAPHSTASTGFAGIGHTHPVRRSFVAYFLPERAHPRTYGVEHCSVGNERASSPAGKKHCESYGGWSGTSWQCWCRSFCLARDSKKQLPREGAFPSTCPRWVERPALICLTSVA